MTPSPSRIVAPFSRLLAALLLAGCTRSGGPPHPEVPQQNFLTYAGSSAKVIPGQYLVVFDTAAVPEASVRARATALVAGTGGKVRYVFLKTFRGFLVSGLTDRWANGVSAAPGVRLVRKDFTVYGQELRGGAFAPVPWNLDRVDQRVPLRLDRDYRLKTGSVGTTPPVPVYVLDNGVYRDHDEFAGPAGSRVENVADVLGTNFARCSLAVPNANHGTRAASIVAGAKLGITPTIIRNVKVLDRDPFGFSCTGGPAGMVAAGLEATYNHMVSTNTTKAVVSLSVGWEVPAPDVAAAIAGLQSLGAIVVAAGGNENKDAAGTEPANLPGVVAVGATNTSDARSVFSATSASNYGATIDLWAPGSDIKAADWTMPENPKATSMASGTSDAAPHVAGAAALLWQQNPTLTASQVIARLVARSTRNWLSNLGAGSVNALLYVGEDAPALGPSHVISHAGSAGGLHAVRVSNDWTRVYVAGGDVSGGGAASGPYGYAGYNLASVGTGPSWQVSRATDPSSPDCLDVHASNATVGQGVAGELVYFGCMGSRAGSREAVIVATQQDNLPLPSWTQPVWLGAGTTMSGITAGLVEGFGPRVLVFALITRPRSPPATGTEVAVASFDGYSGQQVSPPVTLSALGFNEEFHRGVDLVLVDVVNGGSTYTDLVVATYSDPPGSDKTFLWKLDPYTLKLVDWREVPPPPPSVTSKGMFATALAAQALEENGQGIIIPGEVFLATQVAVPAPGGGGVEPWAYVYRVNPDRVTVQSIDVVKDAHINSLWSEDGDLYFGGGTTRAFPPGDPYGARKPGVQPDFDAFLGKNEGVYNSRRWMVTYNTGGTEHNMGAIGFGARKGYLVGEGPSSYYVLEYRVY